MIIWDQSMSTGVEFIDEQHKMLFQKFNDFSAASSNLTIRESAAEALDFLQFYVNWHFGQEEKIMEDCGCPAAAANLKAHQEFTVRFNEFYQQWQNQTMTSALAKQVYAEMEAWIVNHIIKVDAQLHGFADRIK